MATYNHRENDSLCKYTLEDFQSLSLNDIYAIYRELLSYAEKNYKFGYEKGVKDGSTSLKAFDYLTDNLVDNWEDDCGRSYEEGYQSALDDVIIYGKSISEDESFEYYHGDSDGIY